MNVPLTISQALTAFHADRLMFQRQPKSVKSYLLSRPKWDGSVLGRALDRFVVIADGRFWFETDNFDFLERNIQREADLSLNPVRFVRTTNGEQLGRLEIWVRRERGCELLHRDSVRAQRPLVAGDGERY